MTRTKFEAQGRIWLSLDGRPLLGKGRAQLLLRIEQTGSISGAAKSMKMSYKAAWDAVDAMNNALGSPVVESATGGARGGGSQLTALGKHLLAEYDALSNRHQEWLAHSLAGLDLPTGR